MKIRQWLVLMLGIVGVAATPLAHAEGEGWYVGFGRGGSDDRALDDSDSGFKLFSGYRFNKYTALEGAVVNLAYDLGPDGFAKNGISVQGVAILPIGKRFELFARGGLFRWAVTIEDTTNCTSDPFIGTTCEEHELDDGIDPAYAVGAQILAAGRWNVRFEWERFVDVGDGDVDFRSLGVMYKF